MSIEDTLRDLDKRDAAAALDPDPESRAAGLEGFFAPDGILHFAPARRVMTVDEMLGVARQTTDGFWYSSFVRTTEQVAVRGDVAMTFRAEVCCPEGNHPNAGQVVHRRYSHVWRHQDGEWRILLRHVNIDHV